MILLWGELDDQPFASVVTELRRMGAPVLLLTGEALRQAEYNAENGGRIAGSIRLGAAEIALASLTAGYLRPGEAVPDGVASEALTEALLTWADTASARVVNRPSAMAANNSKPYQAGLIRAAGFATPATLITTDPDAVRAFERRHGQVIYKSISGIRSTVARLSPDRQASLDDVTHCPTMFQEYIAGVDYRVHVVDDELFACRIISAADDYRYPKNQLERPTMEAVDLDASLAGLIQTMVHSMNLRVAGVDLRRTSGGLWYCLEVNPSPAFTAFSQITGQPIHRAIARLLAVG